MGNVKKKRRVPFWGKLCASLLCGIIITTTVGDNIRSVSATGADSAIASLQSEIDRLKKQNEQRKNQINSIKGDISANKEAMQMVNEQINGINQEVRACAELIDEKAKIIDERGAQIDAIILTIKDKERSIENKQLEIADLREENRQNLEKFAKLARAMYMKSSSDMIPVLNGSDDWYNYFVYSDVVKNISGQNVMFMQRLQNSIKQQETLIEELDNAIINLQNDKANLQAEKADYEKQMAELEQEKEELVAYANQQTAYYSSLAAKNSQYEKEVSSLQSQIAANDKLIEKNNAEMERIIKEAMEANQNQTVYDDGFLWPVYGSYRKITTPFGYSAYHGGQHKAIDIVGNYAGEIGGTKIYAAQSGTVITAAVTCSHNYAKSGYHGCGYGYGNYIIIDHGGGVCTLYAHCASLNVKRGQHVNKGDVIGIVGTTGWSTGFHLHFEVRKNNTAVNPMNYTYQYQYIK